MHRLFGILVLTAFGLAVDSVAACPFCANLTPTLSEQVTQADVVILTQWVEAQPVRDGKPGFTRFEVVEMMKGPPGAFQRGKTVTLSRFRAGNEGDLFLLMGLGRTLLEWDFPLEVTETSYQYIAQAPARETEESKRLAYYLRFLEFPDDLIANDAYMEFAAARYDDIKPLAETFPQEKLRELVFSEETSPTRLGLYGMMLGLCGTDKDAQKMKAMIEVETDDFRLGMDGVMGGYLLLTRESGLDLLDETKFKPKTTAHSESYSALQAIRFIWTYGDGTISKERLRKSMRLLLDRPGFLELAITDLARWKDWEIQDRLVKMYDDEFDDPRDQKAMRRAIVRFLIVCTKDKPEDAESDPPHVVKAKKHLEAIEKRDPETVRDVSRFVFTP